MFKIAICDDDKSFLISAKKKIADTAHNINMPVEISGFSRPDILLAEIQEDVHRFDIYILDMEMPEAHGFELVKEIKRFDDSIPVILLTSHLAFAIDAFEYGVLRYIPKQQISNRIQSALQTAHSILNDTRCLIIKTARELKKLPHKDIIFLQKEKKYCVVHMDGDHTYPVRKTLETVYKELASPDFIYINRSHIVNLPYVNYVGNGMVYLSDLTAIKLGSTFIDAVRLAIGKYCHIF